jgi:hypothetical protein
VEEQFLVEAGQISRDKWVNLDIPAHLSKTQQIITVRTYEMKKINFELTFLFSSGFSNA